MTFFQAAKIIISLCTINCEIVSPRPTAILEVILYGNKMLNDKENYWMLTATVNYIKNSQRFSAGPSLNI